MVKDWTDNLGSYSQATLTWLQLLLIKKSWAQTKKALFTFLVWNQFCSRFYLHILFGLCKWTMILSTKCSDSRYFHSKVNCFWMTPLRMHGTLLYFGTDCTHPFFCSYLIFLIVHLFRTVDCNSTEIPTSATSMMSQPPGNGLDVILKRPLSEHEDDVSSFGPGFNKSGVAKKPLLAYKEGPLPTISDSLFSLIILVTT